MMKTVILKKKIIYSLLIVSVCVTACTVSYKFRGTSIDYDKVKTISIRDFTNQAEYIYAPLEYTFNEALKDIYRRQTKLNFVPQNGDLHVEGEIIGYNIMSLGVRDNNFSASTQLSITVRVRFTNNTNHDEDFEQTFSTSQTFDSSRQLTEVEPELTPIMVKDLVDMIYNATVANW